VPGTVAVAEHRAVQKLSNVIHTYSRVEGKLDQKKDIFDLLRAVFPGGSITGCPKKRTLQIIDKLEDFRRGVYTGSAGFINFSGDGDFNILIRTMFFKDNKVTFHSGGGIVIDSVAEKEFEETLLKSSAMRDVLAAASAA
jgi:para-aminobenzoate synthetase component 1